MQAAFAKAAKVVELELINNRVICNAMEPRACVPAGTPPTPSSPSRPAPRAAGATATSWPPDLGLEPEQVRVITPDVGGGFGMKAFFYPEYSMAGLRGARPEPAGEVDRRARRELPLRHHGP